MGYFHGYLDGVDYVFVDHACFQGRQGDIYGGDRQSIQFRYGSWKHAFQSQHKEQRAQLIDIKHNTVCPARYDISQLELTVQLCVP